MILDATAGKRMMWFNKQNPETVYLDKKRDVKPSVVADWRNLPFNDCTFDLVIFDPPHMVRPESRFKEGAFLKMFNDYGCLNPQLFRRNLYDAFLELFRVLTEKGLLVFKWNDIDRPVDKILQLALPHRPLVMQRSTAGQKGATQTFWCLFRKS